MKTLGIAIIILIVSLSIIGYCIGACCHEGTAEKNERTQVISYFEQ